MFVGCGFSPAHESNGGDGGGITSDVMMNGSGSDGGSGSGSGSGSSASFLALHVPPAGQSAGTSDLTFTGVVTVDTDALTVGFTLPSGVVFDHWPQSNGPEVAVLHVRALTVTASSQVTVVGSRALVILGNDNMTVIGTLDASANHARPGPAGSPAQNGQGAGGVGLNQSTYYDSGGGGAGFGTVGQKGGNSSGGGPNVAGGAGGSTQGTDMLVNLKGGAGGGNADQLSCGSQTGGSGGAGGGAIQLRDRKSVV